MATSESSESTSKTAKQLAKEIVASLDHSPLLIDVVNEVKTQRNLGIPDEKIKTILKQSFEVKQSEEYESTREEDEGIIVNHLPEKYNSLDWA